MTKAISAITSNIRVFLERLEAFPQEQFPRGKGGKGSAIPDAVLIQRRCANVRINALGASKNTRLIHNRFVLTVLLEGDGLFCSNGKTYYVRAGEAALVYPFQYHHYLVDQSNFFWCVITFTLEHPFFPENLHNCGVAVTDRQYWLLEHLLELYVTCGSEDELMRRYLACLLGEMDRTAGAVQALHCSKEDKANAMQAVEQIHGYICQHLSEAELSLEALASLVHMSRSKLYMVFQKYFDASPADYIRRLRLEQACNMLRNDTEQLGNVASSCGFQSQAAFNRCFMRQFNMTPGEYRRQCRNV